MNFRLGELFSGPGGLAVGALNAECTNNETGELFSISHEWSSDYDQDSCNTYIRNINGASEENVICKDVKDLNIENLNPIDGFAYGFPCNDFSLVGEQKGFKGNFGPLYSYGIKVLN
ncbi:MAG: DNA cytosine methyltransferase, partial [Maribacter dokdonensis]